MTIIIVTSETREAKQEWELQEQRCRRGRGHGRGIITTTTNNNNTAATTTTTTTATTTTTTNHNKHSAIESTAASLTLARLPSRKCCKAS